jgi:hypothetical protein
MVTCISVNCRQLQTNAMGGESEADESAIHCLQSGRTQGQSVSKHFRHFSYLTFFVQSTSPSGLFRSPYRRTQLESTQWRSYGTFKSATLPQPPRLLPALPILQLPASRRYRIVLKGYLPSKGLVRRMLLVRHPVVAQLSKLPPSASRLPVWRQHHLQLQDRQRHRQQTRARRADILPTFRACSPKFKPRTKTRLPP